MNIIHVPEKPTYKVILFLLYSRRNLGSERLPKVVQLLSWQGQIQTPDLPTLLDHTLPTPHKEKLQIRLLWAASRAVSDFCEYTQRQTALYYWVLTPTPHEWGIGFSQLRRVWVYSRSRFKILEKWDQLWKKEAVLTQIHLLMENDLRCSGTGLGTCPTDPICYTLKAEPESVCFCPRATCGFLAPMALFGGLQRFLITQGLWLWPQLKEGQKEPALHQPPTVQKTQLCWALSLAAVWRGTGAPGPPVMSWQISAVVLFFASLAGEWHAWPSTVTPPHLVLLNGLILVPVTKVGQGRPKIAVVASVTVGIWLGTVFYYSACGAHFSVSQRLPWFGLFTMSGR